jgi:hypothetical protein
VYVVRALLGKFPKQVQMQMALLLREARGPVEAQQLLVHGLQPLGVQCPLRRLVLP